MSGLCYDRKRNVLFYLGFSAVLGAARAFA